jgi:hypothetical protein
MADHKHQLDASDLDAIRELTASAGHALVHMRISSEITRLREELERPQTEDRTNVLRGMITGLRTALEIPGIIEDEAFKIVSVKGLRYAR